MSEKLRDFDIAKYLDNNETIAEYLNQILKDGDMDELLSAIKDIAKAKGLNQNTQILDMKPRFDIVMKVLNSFGVQLRAVS